MLLDWWAERLERDCLVDPERGYFVDQRWIDLAPGIVGDVRGPARPRLQRRLLEPARPRSSSARAAAYTVNGRAAALLPLQRLRPATPHVLSKHQDRIRLADDPALARAVRGYADRAARAGHELASHLAVHLRRAAASACRSTSHARASTASRDGRRASTRRCSSRRGRGRVRGLRCAAPAPSGGRHGVTRYLAACTRRARRPAATRSRPRSAIARAASRAGRTPSAATRCRSRRAAAAPDRGPAPSAARRRSVRRPPASTSPATSAPSSASARRAPGDRRARRRRRAVAAGRAGDRAQAARAHALAPCRTARRGSRSTSSASTPTCCPRSPTRSARRSSTAATRSGCGGGRSSAFPERWHGSLRATSTRCGPAPTSWPTRWRAVSPVPVVHVPMPVTLRRRSHRDRAPSWACPRASCFLFVYDYNSVFARKNPLGLIEAFTARVPGARRGRARWSIKSINGERHPRTHGALRRGRRRRIPTCT